MANKDLLLKSHGTLKKEKDKFRKNPDCWWYEEPPGITIVGKVGTRCITVIPWRSIRAALRRKDAAK